jgi:hypothetical protein
MMTPTTNIIAPMQGKVVTRSVAGGEIAATAVSRGSRKINNDCDGAPKKAKGKESTVPPWVTTGSELDGPPSNDQDGAPSRDSLAKKGRPHHAYRAQQGPSKERRDQGWRSSTRSVSHCGVSTRRFSTPNGSN